MAAEPPGTPFQPQLERRMRAEWLIVSGVLLVLTMCLTAWGDRLGLTGLDNVLYDQTLTLTTQSSTRDDIAIIAIDDDSLQDIGYWPWRRAIHADLLDRLTTARAVGLDLILFDSNPAYPNDDPLLAQAIARHGRVVLAAVIDPVRHDVQLPRSPLAESARALGYINIYPDDDGVIRSVLPYQKHPGGGTIQHFSLAMLEAGSANRSWHRMRERAAEPLRIPFSGAPGHYPMYRYSQVLSGEVPASTFTDRFVFVGAWSAGLGDKYTTSLSTQGQTMAGVEVLANTLEAALDDDWIRSPKGVAALVLAALPVLIVCLWLRRLSPRRALLLTLLALTAGLIGNWVLMRYAGYWLPMVSSLLGISLAYPVWSWRSQEVALQHIDRELAVLRQEEHRHLGATATSAAELSTPPLDQSLSARVASLNDAVDRLRDARRRREETLRFLSHDMRAPQNAILALTRLQRGDGADIPAPELLDRIDHQASQTLALVDGFVQLARAENAAMQTVPVDLVDLVSTACDDVWAAARQRGAKVRFDQHPDFAWTRGDPDQLLRVLRNLLDNALKYSPPNTTIHCRLVSDTTYWRIDIQDQGRGISADKLATLFTPFTRLDTEQPDNPQGIGLGLAFVQTIVHKHGGLIQVHSEPSKGSTFSLFLPVDATPTTDM